MVYIMIQNLEFVEFSVLRYDVFDGRVYIYCQGTTFQPGSTRHGGLHSPKQKVSG